MVSYPVLYPVIFTPVEIPRPGKEGLAMMRSLAGKALARSAQRAGLELPALVKDERGAPLPVADLHWSLSHKPRGCAAVVGAGRMGIDIEEVRERRPSLQDAAVTAEEWTILGGRSWAAFFRAWTAKEAVLKAIGIGIAGLSSCRITGSPCPQELSLDYKGSFWLVEYHVHRDLVAALVKQEGQDVAWEIIENVGED